MPHKAIQEIIARAVTQSGFEKKNGGWYLFCDETILVINSQKSKYGQQYYINLGVYLRELGNKSIPKVNECHINTRLEQLFSDDVRIGIQDALNTEAGNGNSWGLIERSLKEVAVPWLIRLSTKKGIRAAHQEGLLRKIAVMKVVSDALTL